MNFAIFARKKDRWFRRNKCLGCDTYV